MKLTITKVSPDQFKEIITEGEPEKREGGEKPVAGLYWTKEDIDSACQVYAIHIAVTNRLVCTIDTDVPAAETFANLFADAPKMHARITELEAQLANVRALEEGTNFCLRETLDRAEAAEAKLAEAEKRAEYERTWKETFSAQAEMLGQTVERLGQAKTRAEAREAAAEKTIAHLRKAKECYYDCVDKAEANQRIAKAEEAAMDVVRPLVEAADARVAAAREALKTIAAWPFDIRGDCVADARKLAQAALSSTPHQPPDVAAWNAAVDECAKVAANMINAGYAGQDTIAAIRDRAKPHGEWREEGGGRKG